MINRRTLVLGAGPALVVTPAAALCALPPRPTPQERIDIARAAINEALAELYPECFLSSQMNLRDGSGGIVFGAHPYVGYEARYFFCDDPAGWSPAVLSGYTVQRE